MSNFLLYRSPPIPQALPSTSPSICSPDSLYVVEVDSIRVSETLQNLRRTPLVEVLGDTPWSQSTCGSIRLDAQVTAAKAEALDCSRLGICPRKQW